MSDTDAEAAPAGAVQSLEELMILHSFCTQDEEHDPSEEFEEWLTCGVCGDHCRFMHCGVEAEKLRPCPVSWFSTSPHSFQWLTRLFKQLIDNVPASRKLIMMQKVCIAASLPTWT